MANELFNSLRNACLAGGHIVFREGVDGGVGRFERAGRRHALATFFGSASAKELNQNTLNKIKEVLNAERTADSVGILDGDTFNQSYFTDSRSLTIADTGDKRVESAAVKRIIASIQKDVVSNPAVREAVKEKVLADFLADSLNYNCMGGCAGAKGDDGRDVAETVARILLNDAMRRNPVGSYEQLMQFRNEMPRKLVGTIHSVGAYFKHIEDDAEEFGVLVEKFRELDAANEGRSNCLERFVLTLVKAATFSDGEVRCDEIAVSRFLWALSQGKGQRLISEHEFSPDEMLDAFRVVTESKITANAADGTPLDDVAMERYVAALELKLSHSETFGGFVPPKASAMADREYVKNVLCGLAAVLPDVKSGDEDHFLAVVADVLKFNADIGGSAESVERAANAVNGAIQFLRGQEKVHPEALKDGIQLMKDLHAPIDANAMKRLLELTKNTADGMADGGAFAETIDRNLSAICFAGGGINSVLGRDEKNWTVARFILSSVPKVRYEEVADPFGRIVSTQRKCADMALSSSCRNLRAFYARVGGPLCAKYAQALDFIVGKYWKSGMCSSVQSDVVNAFQVPAALKEKYEIDIRTAVKPGVCVTSPAGYEEFGGVRAERANAVDLLIAGVVEKSRMFGGDRERVKQLVLQSIAWSCRNGKGVPDDSTIRRITNRYCRMAMWGGALLDRLEKEVPVSHRKAVVLSLEAYDSSSDEKLFEMLTKDRAILDRVKEYIDECAANDDRDHAPEGTSVDAYYIHQILTGKVGAQADLDPRQNPHLATVYSRRTGE